MLEGLESDRRAPIRIRSGHLSLLKLAVEEAVSRATTAPRGIRGPARYRERRFATPVRSVARERVDEDCAQDDYEKRDAARCAEGCAYAPPRHLRKVPPGSEPNPPLVITCDSYRPRAGHRALALGEQASLGLVCLAFLLLRLTRRYW